MAWGEIPLQGTLPFRPTIAVFSFVYFVSFVVDLFPGNYRPPFFEAKIPLQRRILEHPFGL